MESLRRALGTIGKHLGGLSSAHKVIAACVVVIVALGLVIVAQVSGRAAYEVVMPSGTPTEQTAAVSYLSSVGIETRLGPGGEVMVRGGEAARARVMLAKGNALPADKALYFETLLSQQSWMNSRQVNDQNFRVALENELARMITSLNGVESARVRLDIPDTHGLGAGVRTPKASILAHSSDGRALPQSVVDGIARMVDGSVAGLTLERVTVTDGATGANRSVTTDTGAGPTLAMENAARVERETREKLEHMLSNIPGVVVTVTASVDVSRSTAQVQTYLPENKGSVSIEKLASETTRSVEGGATGAAAPGVQANQTADITRGMGEGGAGSRSSTTTNENEVRFGSKTETIVDPKGRSTSVAVSVAVPEAYVAGLMKAPGKEGKEGDAPAEDAVRARFDQQVKPGIVAQVMPHLRTMVAQANAESKPEELRAMLEDSISVVMVPGVGTGMEEPGAVQSAGLMAVLGGGGAGSPMGGLIEKGGLVGLCLVAMGLMVMMVKRAARKETTPNAEELVGLPPTLEAAGDVIGEAEEGETALAGIEVGENEMEAAKRLEQVTEMVEKDPTSTARMMGRWISTED